MYLYLESKKIPISAATGDDTNRTRPGAHPDALLSPRLEMLLVEFFLLQIVLSPMFSCLMNAIRISIAHHSYFHFVPFTLTHNQIKRQGKKARVHKTCQV